MTGVRLHWESFRKIYNKVDPSVFDDVLYAILIYKF
jgi:hypothetical protein